MNQEIEHYKQAAKHKNTIADLSLRKEQRSNFQRELPDDKMSNNQGQVPSRLSLSNHLS